MQKIRNSNNPELFVNKDKIEIITNNKKCQLNLMVLVFMNVPFRIKSINSKSNTKEIIYLGTPINSINPKVKVNSIIKYNNLLENLIVLNINYIFNIR